MTRTERFAEWCARNGVELQPHQLKYAAAALTSSAMVNVLTGGRASGRTYVAERLEQFCDEERRAGRGEEK